MKTSDLQETLWQGKTNVPGYLQNVYLENMKGILILCEL